MTNEKLNELLTEKRKILIFKHSTQCPISAAVHEEVRCFSREEKIPVYKVHVIEDRQISDAIEERTMVTHESPQVILIQNGLVLWHDSHQNITVDAINDAVDS